MANPPPELERIERALARIEAAAARRAYAHDRLTRRHHALRESMTDAIASLDALIGRRSAEPQE